MAPRPPSQIIMSKSVSSISNIGHETKASPTSTPKTKTKWFLGCFGFPRNHYYSKPKSITKKKKTTIVAGGQKNQKSYFKTTFSKLRRLKIKKPAANSVKNTEINVVPLDSNNNSISSSHREGRGSFRLWKDQAQKIFMSASFTKTSSVTPPDQQEPMDEQLDYQEGDTVSANKTAPCRNSSNSKHSVTEHKSSISRILRQGQRTNNYDADERDKDRLIAMSVLVITLIIMLIWGRLCAILCTSASFYCVPRFLASTNKINSHNDDDNWYKKYHLEIMSSEFYKKKLILHGLLHRRSHKNRVPPKLACLS